ncbi:hypothetical protein KJ611_02315 [Patescibacteria group bacterium]|nr:hypothetical protein [Patescibacteria group bacterium]MBU1705355.1 hypothetical protein [Patescibacteria group bacterium]
MKTIVPSGKWLAKAQLKLRQGSPPHKVEAKLKPLITSVIEFIRVVKMVVNAFRSFDRQST